MMRFVVSSGWALLGLTVLAAACAGGARAGGSGPHAVGIPGIGPGTGVDVYIPNPDGQTPIAWSQGTEPPPPQGDYGGGVLQYMITGNEARPVPHPDVPPPYFPGRVAPVRGPDGRIGLLTHARPPAGASSHAAPRTLPPPTYGDAGYAGAAPAYAEPAPPSPARSGFGFGGTGAYGGPVYGVGPQARAVYVRSAYPDGRPAETDPVYLRQEVAYSGGQRPGTIVIDTASKFLYLVEDEGRALRYGIGVAKPGFLWSGNHAITRKAEWPDWTPPAEMLGRRPDLPRHMDGGLENPLGARALYLGSTLYRIHGTNEPNTIGTNVSSGCIRLRNEDVTDLYDRVRVGTRVVVM